MMRFVAVVAVFSAAHAMRSSRTESGMWAPSDVQMVSAALDSILGMHHLSKDQMASAQRVAAKVKQSLANVTSQQLKGDARRKVVGEALAALTGLEQEFDRTEESAKVKEAADEAAFEKHQEDMQKDLVAKERVVAKDEDEMKVLDLELDLARKKLKLNTLKEKQEAAAAAQALEQEKKDHQMLATMSTMADQLSNRTVKSDILLHLQSRLKRVNDAISQLDVDAKEVDAKVAGLQKTGDAKMTKMLMKLSKEEHRKFSKSKAMSTREATDLKRAIAMAEKGDAGALKESLKKLRADAKMSEASSGNFLH